MTREEFEYAIKSCGCFIYRGHIYYEETELIKAFEDMGLIKQEPTDENLHREREQAYMQGYEDASKRFRQEPCEDAISRQAVDVLVYELARAISDERCCISRGRSTATIMQNILDLPSVKPQICEDAISRQAVIDAIYDMEILKYRIDLENVIKALPSVKPQKPKWIPVSERLPEEDTAVLIWCPERRNIYCAYLEEKQWWIFGAYFQKVLLEVIAWMPLPKPYDPQERSE